MCEILKKLDPEVTEIRQLNTIMTKLQKGQKYLGASAKIMENLIHDLLDYSQIKAGKFRKNLKYFDIKETVKETFGILMTKADAKNITLVHIFGVLSQRIYHDEQRITQILLNL